jgi:dihydrofolate reductase
MGRKTWDSIPPKFRPLKGRLNIVISRSHDADNSTTGPINPDTDPVRVNSLDKAVEYVAAAVPVPVARAFVIGGAQIYGAALARPEARRVLLTHIATEFACDTFFPLRLGEAEGSAVGWARSSKAVHDAWAGEEVPAGVQEESGTQYEFQMWEKAE